MNIVMVTNNYSPYSGGVVSSINAQVDALQKLGHIVTLITLDFSGKNYQDPTWVKRLYCPITFIYKKNHMAIPWRAKKQIRQLISEIKPDIVHVHHPFLLGHSAMQVAKQMHIPMIFTYHTIYEAYAHYIPLPQAFVKKITTYSVLKFCRQVDGIIAPSSSIQDYLIDNTIETPIKVIPSGLLSIFLPTHIKKRPVENGMLHLLVVSRMTKEKNIKAILHVAQQLIEQNVLFQLKLIGFGVEYDHLREYAFEQLRLPKDVVQFIYKPSKNEIEQAYQSADMFLFPSKTDTQGLVLAEAMAAGAPVIAFDGAGQRDIIKQAQNGYIVVNEGEMVDVIKELAHSPEQLSLLSEYAHETGQNYKPAVLAQKLIQFYQCFL
ncbi:MAG: glycosyltransferase [Candidatus Dependentiae bacterium]